MDEEALSNPTGLQSQISGNSLSFIPLAQRRAGRRRQASGARLRPPADHAWLRGQFQTGAPGTIDCLQGNLGWALLELGYEIPGLRQHLSDGP
jgi:hypothetical protein